MGIDRTALLVACMAFVLYLPGFWWGAPHATAPDRKQSWGVDDETPLGPLAEIHNIIAPKADRNVGYALMFSFSVVAAYAPYLAYLKLTGQWTEVSAVYPYGMSDPVHVLKMLTYIAHFLTVLMGVGIVVAAFDAGRTLWDHRTGMLSALFAMTLYPMFYYARVSNVDVPVLFFVALSISVFVRCLGRGFTGRRAVWLGIFAGLALATKESALGIFIGMALVLLVRHWQQRRDWASWDFWAVPLVGVFACAVSLGLGSGLFVDPERYFAHLDYLAGNLEMARSGALIIDGGFPFSWEGHLGFIVQMYHYIVDIMTLPGFLLALAGVGWATWKEKKGALAFLAIAYVLYMFLLARSSQMRYLMPAAFLLSFYAGRAVIVAWESRWPLIRGAFAMLACGIITVSLLRGIGLTYEMIKDSRFAAGEWLAAQTEAGDRVEFFGPVGKLPPLEAGVVTGQAADYLGIFVRTPVDAAKVEEIRRGWQERKPQFVITMPDLSSPSGVPHNISLPPEVYDGLMDGTMGYRLAAQFKTPPLFPWLPKPALDYPTVNPVIRVFVREDDSVREADSPRASFAVMLPIL